MAQYDINLREYWRIIRKRKVLMAMDKGRKFVLHRNDAGVPSDRKIEVIETESSKLRGYPEISVIIPTVIETAYSPPC